MQFTIHETRLPGEYSKDVIDMMMDAANGRPLPGRLGLVQALCNVWTSSPPPPAANPVQKVLWATKASLTTLGVWRTYKTSMETVSQVKPDSFTEFCSELNLVQPTSFYHMADLIHRASKNTVPYEDLNLRDTKSYIVRKFIPSQGPTYYFKVYPSTNGLDDHPSEGPLFPKGSDAASLVTIRDVLWAQFNSRTIRLTANTSTGSRGYQENMLDVRDAGIPDPFISDESSAEWANANVYAKRCHAFMSQGLVRGVLFYGPPGSGKTSLAMNVLGDSGRVMKITSTAINFSDFAPIARLIDVLDPQVILFDDIDRFTRSNLTAMLEYMEGLKKAAPKTGRIIIGTVNVLEMLDPALLRSGRFDEVLFVPEPSVGQRIALIRHYIKFFGASVAELDAVSIANQMEGFSPADIRSVIESVACVGTEYLNAEIGRTRMQRSMSTDDKILHYLKDRPGEVSSPSQISRY